jgi:hypothetical protein
MARRVGQARMPTLKSRNPDGRQIEKSGTSVNTPASIDDSLEPDSRVNVQREEHFTKQNCRSRSTDAGMQIDGRLQQPLKANSSIDKSFDLDSNVTEARK